MYIYIYQNLNTVDADTHGRTPPLSSCGTCYPTDEYPTAQRGHTGGEIRSVSPQPMVPPVLLPPAGSSPNLWGPHRQFLAVVNTSTSTSTNVYVCVSY